MRIYLVHVLTNVHIFPKREARSLSTVYRLIYRRECIRAVTSQYMHMLAFLRNVTLERISSIFAFSQNIKRMR